MFDYACLRPQMQTPYSEVSPNHLFAFINSMATLSTIRSSTVKSHWFKPHLVQSLCFSQRPNLKQSCRSASSTATQKRRSDEDIPHRVVQLVDAETGRLNPPSALRDLLSSIDRKTHHIELVREEPNPIVKIINKKEAFNKRKEQKARMKEVARKCTQKEIQMTWGVASGDLAHKLNKVREELMKGNRVDLVYAPKKGQPLPSPIEMELRAQETVDFLADVGKEWKSREVQRTVTALYLQGTSRPT